MCLVCNKIIREHTNRDGHYPAGTIYLGGFCSNECWNQHLINKEINKQKTLEKQKLRVNRDRKRRKLIPLKEGEICYFCNEELAKHNHHIRPIKYGGLDTEANLIPVCNSCHRTLENLTEDFFKALIFQDKTLSKRIAYHREHRDDWSYSKKILLMFDFLSTCFCCDKKN